jgi:hypothetical protein
MQDGFKSRISYRASRPQSARLSAVVVFPIQNDAVMWRLRKACYFITAF